MAGHPHQVHSNLQQMSAEMDPSAWPAQDYTPGPSIHDGVSGEMKSPSGGGMAFLKSFGTMQKKITRGTQHRAEIGAVLRVADGQPAKRRGPKPDSKPAQTRRQELNRQAQRTHRERKENYIKALEIELSRLRETFVHEQNVRDTTIQQQRLIIETQQRENMALRDLLASRGIAFEAELENRTTMLMMKPKREENSLSPPAGGTFNAASMGGMPIAYPASMPGPPSIGTAYSPQNYLNGGGPAGGSGHSPGTTHHSHSPPGPELGESRLRQDEVGPIPDMPPPGPGIFEKDPQLGIDFILELEQTCRDHEEYLVRRSMDSPDNDDALFSGHALMASCPPPSHIARVPAQQGGLVPTYDHKAPDAESVQILNKLLNLSQSLRGSAIPSGQVTPVMALQSLKGHRNYASLTREDVLGMIDAIKSKVRCYGFGAVMEDFELRDALSGIFATKPETYDQLGTDYSTEIEEMYA